VVDTISKTPLRLAREKRGLARERVAAQLDPPISSKTLERWETPGYPVPEWRLEQLAELYKTRINKLRVAA
jgi:DNA-binding transcriptional regulator YiaG